MTKDRARVDKQKITIYLPPDQMNKLKDLADEHSVTYSHMVEKLVRAKKLSKSVSPIAEGLS